MDSGVGVESGPLGNRSAKRAKESLKSPTRLGEKTWVISWLATQFSRIVLVAILGWTSESAGVAEFVALLPFEGTVPACQVAGVVVHSDHGLIIPVSVRHSGNEVVLIRSDVNVGHGEQID